MNIFRNKEIFLVKSSFSSPYTESCEKFFGERHIVFGTVAARRIVNDVLTVDGRRSNSDVLADLRLEHKGAKRLAHLLLYVLRESGFLITGDEHTRDMGIPVQLLVDFGNGLADELETLERKSLCSQRDNDLVTGNHTVNGEDSQRRGTIHQDDIVVFLNGLKKIAENTLPGHDGCQLDFGGAQVKRGRNQV